MFRGVALAVVVVAASLVGVGAVAAEAEAPVPTAGLDQRVQQGSMVYLDAGGSFDPDGTVTGYEWEITAPNGTTMSPACASCAQTQFQATQNGTYEVTVVVTDDSGLSRVDTLYVDAQAVDPPSVSVTGPQTVQNGTTASFDATVTAGDRELERLIWSVNGTTVSQQSLSGQSVERTIEHTVSTTGKRVMRVRAIDRVGNDDRATHIVDSSGVPSTDGSNNGGGFEVLDRLGNPDGAYYLFLNDDGTVTGGENNDIRLSRTQIRRLKASTGVDTGSPHINTGPRNALIIDNPRIKEDLNKDAGQLGKGLQGDELTYTSPGSDYEYKPKWQVSDPGYNWERVEKRQIDRVRKKSRVDRDNYEFADTINSPTSDTYTASRRQTPEDRRIGQSSSTTTRWENSPSGGTVVDTRQTLDYYTWTEVERRSKRVKVGTRTVGYEKVYGYTTEIESETRTKCTDYVSVLGKNVCIDEVTVTDVFTSKEWGVVDKEPITEPVYDTKMVWDQVTKRGNSPPGDARNIDAHYDTEYKIETTQTTPLWQEYEKKYVYNVYEYKWARK